MDDVKPMMTDLLVTSLRIANGLLASGHESFCCFAVALRADGRRVCVVSDPADFVPVLALLPGTTGVAGAGPIDEPAPEAECLGADPGDDHEDAILERLQALVEQGELVATAVTEAEPDWEHSSGPVPTVWVKLEHASGWTVLYTQTYSVIDGELEIGRVDTFEHEAEVFER